MKPIFKWIIWLWILIIEINIVRQFNETIWKISVGIFILYAIIMLIKLRKQFYEALEDEEDKDFIQKI